VELQDLLFRSPARLRMPKKRDAVMTTITIAVVTMATFLCHRESVSRQLES
jgi:hypothetical protein